MESHEPEHRQMGMLVLLTPNPCTMIMTVCYICHCCGSVLETGSSRVVMEVGKQTLMMLIFLLQVIEAGQSEENNGP